MQKWILVHNEITNYERFKLEDGPYKGQYSLGYGGAYEEICESIHDVVCNNNEAFPEEGEWCYNEERYKNGMKHICGFFDKDRAIHTYVNNLDEACDELIAGAEDASDWQDFIDKAIASGKYKVACITGTWKNDSEYNY